MTVPINISVGSTAAKFHWPEFPREPKDMDVFSNSPQQGEDAFWDDRLFDYFYHRGPGPVARFATPNELYTIKLSHTEWELRNGSWNKHMVDLLWMQQKGCQVDEGLYKLLRSIWVDRYGDRKFNLADDKSNFFDDAVLRKYDHDSLHRSVALTPGFPMYEFFLKPGAQVDMDMPKVWDCLDKSSNGKQVVLDLFYEEIAVTALERKVIPSNFTASPAGAWAWATRRTITSLTREIFQIYSGELFVLSNGPVRLHRTAQEELSSTGGTVTLYSNEEILAALGAAKTVGDVAEFLNIDIDDVPKLTKLEPMPNFAGFAAKDLEDWFNQENLLEDGWDEAGYYLKNGSRYDYNAGHGAVEVKIKPFVHGEVAVEDDEETGGEGHGEDIYIVFSVEDYEKHPIDESTRKRYFQKTGYYQSYDGSNWDGEFTEVWPKNVKVTRWVTKKP